MIKRNDPCWCGSGKKYKKCHMASDEARRRESPRIRKAEPRLIKNAAEIEAMRVAGKFNGELMEYLRPFVKAGISTGHIDELVRDYTARHGHTAASLGYRGFPRSCCVSVNEVVCHGIPSDKELLRDGDIVNVDLTTVVKGFFGDSSETFLIGNVDEKARHLVEVTARAMINGIRAVRPGAPLSDIAKAVESYVRSEGCSVVHQYTGHGIGKKFHEYYSVFHHIDPEFDDILMEPGMSFTVEPMVNLGSWEVDTDKGDGWTVRTRDGSLSAQFEHTVLVTPSGAEILTLTPSQRSREMVVSACGMELRL
jgi:methionyl aminopeptidase